MVYGKMRSAVMFLITATSEDLASRDIEMSIIETMERNEQLTTLHVSPSRVGASGTYQAFTPLDRELASALPREQPATRGSLLISSFIGRSEPIEHGVKGYTLAEGRATTWRPLSGSLGHSTRNIPEVAMTMKLSPELAACLVFS